MWRKAIARIGCGTRSHSRGPIRSHVAGLASTSSYLASMASRASPRSDGGTLSQSSTCMRRHRVTSERTSSRVATCGTFTHAAVIVRATGRVSKNTSWMLTGATAGSGPTAQRRSASLTQRTVNSVTHPAITSTTMLRSSQVGNRHVADGRIARPSTGANDLGRSAMMDAFTCASGQGRARLVPRLAPVGRPPNRAFPTDCHRRGFPRLAK